MCRSSAQGGRRCPGGYSHTRANQAARQRLSRAHRALHTAETTGDPSAVATARRRLDTARTAVADTRTAAVALRSPLVLPMPAGAPVTERRLGGSVAETSLVTYADGTTLIRKVHGHRAANDADPVALTDAEELAPHVLAAVGLRAAAVHRTAATEVHMEFVHGRIGDDVVAYGATVPSEIRDSDEGRVLGLADHLMMNTDRNEGNWIQTDDGHIVGIDHGGAFEHTATSSSPFAGALYDATGSEPLPAARNDFSPADMATVGHRLEALRPEFERLNRGDWHTAMMRRHRQIANAATGTTHHIT
jgi:hypothetical protein